YVQVKKIQSAAGQSPDALSTFDARSNAPLQMQVSRNNPAPKAAIQAPKASAQLGAAATPNTLRQARIGASALIASMQRGTAKATNSPPAMKPITAGV